jgi:subtilase family serine protease
MSPRSWLKLLPAALLVAGACTPFLHAAPQDRIASAISQQSRLTLAHTVTPRALGAIDQGAADPGLVLPSMTLRFNLSASAQAALTELLLEQQQPGSPNYHNWLTPEQYAAQFGLSANDIAKVQSWLTAQGFTVTYVARSRTFITFSGTASQVQQAFGTTIHNVIANGTRHYANLTDPQIPAALAGVVSGITGLHDFKLTPRIKPQHVPAPGSDALHANFTSSISGNHYIAPGDFYTIYNEAPLITAATPINGTGITIAVMGQVDISTSDVSAFRSASGLSTTNLPTTKLYGTDPGSPSTPCLEGIQTNNCVPSPDDLIESQLDVEWSGATAPGANILFVNSTDVIDTSLTEAIDNNLAPIMTISYGDCESAYGQATLQAFNLLFQQANAQGITILGPSGDSGATDCDYDTTLATQGLAVDFPASSPYVTGVGGTQFNEGTTNYWNTTNNTYGGSAISYIPEAVWNDGSGVAGGGGGSSAYFTKPAWQTGTGVPADYSRDVPDVAFDASDAHDPILYCAEGSCTNGFRNSANDLQVAGGTSFSTPSFAGIMALVEQKIGSRIGNANPTLYALANSSSYSSIFNDVTVGTNAQPCEAGTPNCPSGGLIGYSATTGYDLASGWGSVNAYNLVYDWSSVSPIGVTGIGQTQSNTIITPSLTNLSAGTSDTLTVRVAPCTSATFNGVAITCPTTTPTGTVTILVDGAATSVSGSNTLVSGTATLTLATGSLASGTHTITAVYSGDTTFAGSKGNSNIDLTAASAADFSLGGSVSTVTVQPGATATVTYTLTSVNSFAGSVTMNASSPSLTASGGFSVSPVTLTANGTATTVFTLEAFVSSAHSQPITLGANYPPSSAPWTIAGGGAALASLLFILLPGRKRRLTRSTGILAMLLLSAGALAISGCSSSGSATTTSTQTNSSPGTYPVTITAQSGSLTHTTTLTVVIP